jgi:ribosome-associated translation inhibitor RaiA
MQIQISTTNDVKGSESFDDYAKRAVESGLSHFSDRITRVEVHLADENGHKHGPDDKRCSMEARAEGRKPTGVTHHAPTFEQAVDGAAHKLKHALESTFKRLRDQRHDTPVIKDAVAE